MIWHITAITIATASTVMADSSAKEYQNLYNDNLSLNSTDAKTGLSESEQLAQKDIFDTNKDGMAGAKSTIDSLNMVTAVAVTWELYLLIFGGSDSNDQASLDQPSNNIPQINFSNNFNQQNPKARINLTWNW